MSGGERLRVGPIFVGLSLFVIALAHEKVRNVEVVHIADGQQYAHIEVASAYGLADGVFIDTQKCRCLLLGNPSSRQKFTEFATGIDNF